MSPRLGQAQAAWLAEIGIDPHWLGLLGPARRAAPRAAGGAAPVVPAMIAAPAVPAVAPAIPAAKVRPAMPAAPAGEADGQAQTPAADDQEGGLAAVDQAIQACQACGLHAGRAWTVPGIGQTDSPEYLIVGEMPGAADDVAGRLFEGQAGSLLRAMLAGARLPHSESAYLTNVLKCRPPGGRAAQAAEVAACLPHLRRQIEVLRPRHILVLGRLAAQALLGTRAPLAELRGRQHTYALSDGSTIALWVTHHPASLLVRPAHKAQAWADLAALARAARDPA
uniref:uracil-DNA glycosylase n=1 Tax=Castellaniella defragrans TaxID=75697 RepID=UPI00333EA8A9